MFSKNEYETERRPIGFIQEEDGKKYLGKDYLYPWQMKPPLGEEAVSGMDLKREGANISLAIKFLGRGGAGSPSVLT